jgi:hypothetical protein
MPSSPNRERPQAHLFRRDTYTIFLAIFFENAAVHNAFVDGPLLVFLGSDIAHVTGGLLEHSNVIRTKPTQIISLPRSLLPQRLVAS